MQTCKKRFTYVISVVFFGVSEGLVTQSIEHGTRRTRGSAIHADVELVQFHDDAAGVAAVHDDEEREAVTYGRAADSLTPTANASQMALRSADLSFSDIVLSATDGASRMDIFLCVAVSIAIVGGCCAACYMLACRKGGEEEDVNRVQDDRRHFRHTCFQALHGGDTGCSLCGFDLSAIISVFIMVLVIVNVGFVVFESDQNKNTPIYTVWYHHLVEFSLVVFSAEYCLRLWCSIEDEQFKEDRSPRLSFVLSPFALIDLTALIPFAYDLYFADGHDFKAASLIRLFRVFSLLRLERNVRSFARVFKVLRNKGEELMVTLFVALIMLIVSASLIYCLENEKQPKQFPSIAASMWWAVAALTTVGYGDIYPITTSGKVVACFVAFIGIGFFALPAGIIGSGFVETMIEEKQASSETDSVRKAVKALRDDQPQEALKILEGELNLLVEKMDHL